MTISLKTNVDRLTGEIHVPGDKSISHRSIMFGSLAYGKTTVTNFLTGDDCLSTIRCFRKLGVTIEEREHTIEVYGNGLEGLTEPKEVLNVGNSGTTIRLLLGILAGREFYSTLEGDESIAKRPMTRVTNPLKQMGAQIDGREYAKYTPISVRGGRLKGIHYDMPVASAQVKSAILLAGLQAFGVTSVLEPSKTRDHTERMIQQFGGEVKVDGLQVSVAGGQRLKGTHIHVPGDISSAAFFLVAGAIVPQSSILLKNVGLNPTRTGILNVLQQMGANVTTCNHQLDQFEPVGDLRIETSNLQATVIEGDIIPKLIDEIPIIALLATQAEGKTIIRDAEELKVKETNRIDTVVQELQKLGAKIEATDDGMIIHGRSKLHGGKVNSHGDHRIGMMLAVAALIAEGEVELENAEAISVSYPTFFEHLQDLMEN